MTREWLGFDFFLLTMQRNHPSALGSFDRIAAAARGKTIVMFMDYDGTLSPIVTDPDRAFMTAEVSGIDGHRPAPVSCAPARSR